MGTCQRCVSVSGGASHASFGAPTAMTPSPPSCAGDRASSSPLPLATVSASCSDCRRMLASTAAASAARALLPPAGRSQCCSRQQSFGSHLAKYHALCHPVPDLCTDEHVIQTAASVLPYWSPLLCKHDVLMRTRRRETFPCMFHTEVRRPHCLFSGQKHGVCGVRRWTRG